MRPKSTNEGMMAVAEKTKIETNMWPFGTAQVRGVNRTSYGDDDDQHHCITGQSGGRPRMGFGLYF
jgi:hypothetical protein